MLKTKLRGSQKKKKKKKGNRKEENKIRKSIKNEDLLVMSKIKKDL